MTLVAAEAYPYGRGSSLFTAALMALAGVILLQPLFIGSLVFVRRNTDLEPIRRNIVAAYEQGVLSVDEVPRLL